MHLAMSLMFPKNNRSEQNILVSTSISKFGESHYIILPSRTFVFLFFSYSLYLPPSLFLSPPTSLSLLSSICLFLSLSLFFHLTLPSLSLPSYLYLSLTPSLTLSPSSSSYGSYIFFQSSRMYGI